MRISGPRQRLAVSQGIALGFTLCGRFEFPFEKPRIDLAFDRAWQEWPGDYALQFSQVCTDLRNGIDPVWVMTRADKSKRVRPLYWEHSGTAITIGRRIRDWDPAVPDDVTYAYTGIDGDVPLFGWQALAAAFINDFDRT